MDDEHLLALGKAVHAFQTLEWLTIWVSVLLSEDGDITRFEGLPFGQLVKRLRERLSAEPAAGQPVREAAVQWVGSLGAVNRVFPDEWGAGVVVGTGGIHH